MVATTWITNSTYAFLARSQDCEKRLLASTCLSAWNNSAPNGRIFTKFYVWAFFQKSVEKIQVPFTSDQKKNDTLLYTFFIIYSSILLMMNVLNKSFREHQGSWWVTFLRKSYRLWEMWKNTVEPEMSNDNMAHAHFTQNPYGYKHTLEIHNTYCFSSATLATRSLNVAL